MVMAIEGAAPAQNGWAQFNGADAVVVLGTATPDDGNAMPTNCRMCEIHVDGAAVRMTNNGATPTSTSGYKIAAGAIRKIENALDYIPALKIFIPTGATVYVEWM